MTGFTGRLLLKCVYKLSKGENVILIVSCPQVAQKELNRLIRICEVTFGDLKDESIIKEVKKYNLSAKNGGNIIIVPTNHNIMCVMKAKTIHHAYIDNSVDERLKPKIYGFFYDRGLTPDMID